jgi:hypothetical protein
LLALNSIGKETREKIIIPIRRNTPTYIKNTFLKNIPHAKTRGLDCPIRARGLAILFLNLIGIKPLSSCTACSTSCATMPKEVIEGDSIIFLQRWSVLF